VIGNKNRDNRGSNEGCVSKITGKSMKKKEKTWIFEMPRFRSDKTNLDELYKGTSINYVTLSSFLIIITLQKYQYL
jgi:hypothetical protein